MFRNEISFIWITDKRELFDNIFLNNIISLLKNVYSRCSWDNKDTNFFSKSKSENRPVRLRNIGLNCYLNSSFQSMVACSHFVREMKDLEGIYPTSKALFVFNKILHSLSDSTNDDVELSSNEILRNWNKSGEQDTYELLSHVIFQVFNEITKYQKGNSTSSNPLTEMLRKERLPLKLFIEFRIRCDCGYNFSPTLQSDLALHLSVPFRIYSEKKNFTIENLLDNYFVPENILDFCCKNSSCVNGNITKFLILCKPMPTTFCIHIQRSFWNPGKKVMEKNNEKVLFEEKLLLKNDFFSEHRVFPNGPLSSAIIDIIESGNMMKNIIEDVGCPNDREGRGDHSRRDMAIPDEKLIINNKEHNRSDERDADKCQGVDVSQINENDLSIISNISELEKSLGEISKLDFTQSIDVNPDLKKESTIEENCSNQVDDLIIGTIEDVTIKYQVNGCVSDVNIDKSDSKSRESLINKIESTHALNGINPLEESSPAKNIGEKLQNLETSNKLKIPEVIKGEEYYLKSVIVHFGRAESGHYICYRKCGTKWFCTNDNFITEVKFKEVQDSQAYILMYEKAI